MDNCFTYSQKNLAHIGYYLLKTMPEVADKIISERPIPNLVEKSPSLIPEYFTRYCQLLNLSPEDMVQIKNSYQLVERKRQFVGIILKIYYPEVFVNSSAYFVARRGVVKYLSTATGMQVSNTSKMITEVKRWIWVYPDFAGTITTIYQQLMEQDGSTISEG